jgi:hypothetical protein
MDLSSTNTMRIGGKNTLYWRSKCACSELTIACFNVLSVLTFIWCTLMNFDQHDQKFKHCWISMLAVDRFPNWKVVAKDDLNISN